MCSQAVYLSKRKEERMKRKTDAPGGGAEGRNEQKGSSSFSCHGPQGTPASEEASGGGLGASRRPGSCCLGSGSPQGQAQARNGFCVCKISLCKRHWWGNGGAAGRLPHHRQDPLCPESGPQSQDYPSLPQRLGLCTLIPFRSLPSAQW